MRVRCTRVCVHEEKGKGGVARVRGITRVRGCSTRGLTCACGSAASSVIPARHLANSAASSCAPIEKRKEQSRLGRGRRRAVRAAPSLHAAEAALRGAQARPGPLKSRQTGGGGGVLGQRGRRGLVSLSRRAPCRLAAAHELSELLDCDVPRALGNGRAWVTEGVGRDAGAPRELRETI